MGQEELRRIRNELKALTAEADREDREWSSERKRMADELEQLEVERLSEKRSQKLIELDIAVLTEKLDFLSANQSKRPTELTWREYGVVLQNQNQKYSSDVHYWQSRNKALQVQINETFEENRRFLGLLKSSMGIQQMEKIPTELQSDLE